MKIDNSQWEQLFAEQAHTQLGLLLQKRGLLDNRRPVRALADDEVVLSGAVESAARRTKRAVPQTQRILSVAIMPESDGETWETYCERLLDLRREHPEAEMAGVGTMDRPFKDRFAGLDRGVFLAGRLDAGFEASFELLESRKGVEGPSQLTGVLVYSPEVTASAVKAAVRELLDTPKLKSVVALPTGAGDRIPLPGVTTSGTSDVMVISALRYLLPGEVRVRASWAALGWKVAQVCLAYGADECAGWSTAEALVYSPRVRAAARCEREELEAGLEEALVTRAPWIRQCEGVKS